MPGPGPWLLLDLPELKFHLGGGGGVETPAFVRPVPSEPAVRQEAALETDAAALDRRDKVDPLDASRGGEDFYQVQDGNHYCKKCSAGTYVAQHCKEPNGSSVCLPCEKDEYIEYPNDFSKCLGCQRCREDQVELSPCRATSNTQCACKRGTFCSPDHPCEMCQKCRPRCPQGEVELAPCTPHSDRQCGPPTGTVSGLSYNYIVIIVVAVVVLPVVLFCFWKYRSCCCPGGGRDLSRKSCNVVEYVVQRMTRYQRGRTEVEDNFQNERILVPVQGEDPVILLRRSFDFFARDVPYKDWKRYGRALDLLENDIVLAELNDKYSLEPFFQMLNTWHNRQGMNASVNTLLETLRRINLGGIAKDISSKLVQQGYFQYEVS
ncbi:tumor necrosis factor receptor superfamily member 10B isoform X2 [Larus michahellis]|uniref:tumor necrosis factor receptor superfamily member 10B isoform X2 n=1 Tax=Larus michahellis TaxID=119627 RepID=UPI003D9AEAFB